MKHPIYFCLSQLLTKGRWVKNDGWFCFETVLIPLFEKQKLKLTVVIAIIDRSVDHLKESINFSVEFHWDPGISSGFPAAIFVPHSHKYETR